jgi:hypothetical protein
MSNTDRMMFIRGDLSDAQMQILDRENPNWLALDAYSTDEKEYLRVLDVCGLLQEEAKKRIVSRAPQFTWRSRLDYERKVAEWKKNVLQTAVAQPDLFLKVDGYAIGIFDFVMRSVVGVHGAIERMEREGLTETSVVITTKLRQE